MSGIRYQFDDLVKEVKALSYFHKVTDEQLTAKVKAFEALWDGPAVPTDELQEAVNDIEARMEDVCIKHRIGQEQLERAMEDDPAYANQPI